MEEKDYFDTQQNMQQPESERRPESEQQSELERQPESERRPELEQPSGTEQEPAAEQNRGDGTEKKKVSLLRELLSIVEIFVAAFILAQFVVHFVLINAEVPSESMQNIIEPGDRLFGFRLAYTFGDPDRFDVVIFRYPVDESQNFIKRIIGLPGETVEIREGKIYIDGADTPLDEPYLPEEWDEDNDGYVFEVPSDSYLVLGDNRNISLDARFWSAKALNEGLAENEQEAEKYTYVDSDQILGRAIFKYYPHFKSLLSY